MNKVEADIIDDITYHFHDHEVCLSFDNDKDANEFRCWWKTVGNRRFAEWLEIPEFKTRGV